MQSYAWQPVAAPPFDNSISSYDGSQKMNWKTADRLFPLKCQPSGDAGQQVICIVRHVIRIDQGEACVRLRSPASAKARFRLRARPAVTSLQPAHKRALPQYSPRPPKKLRGPLPAVKNAWFEVTGAPRWSRGRARLVGRPHRNISAECKKGREKIKHGCVGK